ncbi:MAG: hypothetical protein ACHQUC_10705 [Chlamydiales bacterium]
MSVGIAFVEKFLFFLDQNGKEACKFYLNWERRIGFRRVKTSIQAGTVEN